MRAWRYQHGKRHSIQHVLFFLGLLGWSTLAHAVQWPQEITAPEGTIVLYQPQPESLVGNILSGRAAVSLELKHREDAIFGAMWFTARIDTDRDQDIAFVRDVKVTKVGWPDSKEAEERRFTQVVEAAMPTAGYEISLERLSASLEKASAEQKSLDDLKTVPPKIVFSNSLAVLLLYDGQPRFSPVKNSDYERVLNTPFVVVRNKKTQTLFLSSGTLWYQATDPLGPWSSTSTPPADLVKLLPAPASDQPAPKRPPKIVVATEPTELISTDGKPRWKSLPGGAILYVENTETPWLRELSTGNMYVLLSGRWYRSKSESGPWVFVPANELPASFKAIPPASDIGGLRTSVADTEEAKQAMLDTAIPQTAAIKRSEASLEVTYDGAPKFEKIPGTNVSYALNTGTQVLEIEGRYYAVDNGVWFTSASANGPWAVADEIPEDDIKKIPPSSPVYNTTYVQIYESTPDVVYVGYTPGYLWSFPYYGVPVYGTGWYYPPYWGTWYYPRPPTWGLHVGYNPWTGWNFGASWSNGFFSFGVSWGGGWGGAYRPWGCYGGWYGGGYRGPTVINTGDINIGNNVNIGNRETIRNRINKDTRLNDKHLSRENIYNRPQNRARNADHAVAKRELQRARPAPNRANNVFADQSGAVARRAGDNWESRVDGTWKRDLPAQDHITPATRERAEEARDRITPETREQFSQQARERVSRPTYQSRPQLDRRDLNRAYHARQRGASWERARPMRGGGRGRHRR